ncbi:MAG: hypothetical protein QM775_07430 [Pirellulales bacterium]
MRRLAFIIALCSAMAASSAGVAVEPLAIVEHVTAHHEPSAVASIPWDAYAAATSDPAELRKLPIGVFDSGIGGLTVLEAILKLDQHDNKTGATGADGRPDFEGERFIYLGDQANMPYGNYPSAARVEFLRELIVRNALFLLGNRYHGTLPTDPPRFDKPPVKAIVIACNTATAYGLEDIRAALEQWKIPVLVVGVVEAGGRGVVDAMRQDTTRGAAAVLATVGTCLERGLSANHRTARRSARFASAGRLPTRERRAGRSHRREPGLRRFGTSTPRRFERRDLSRPVRIAQTGEARSQIDAHLRLRAGRPHRRPRRLAESAAQFR